jgi:hypothetical protein
MFMGLHKILISLTARRTVFTWGRRGYEMIGVSKIRQSARPLRMFIVQSASYQRKQDIIKCRIPGISECRDEGCGS